MTTNLNLTPKAPAFEEGGLGSPFDREWRGAPLVPADADALVVSVVSKSGRAGPHQGWPMRGVPASGGAAHLTHAEEDALVARLHDASLPEKERFKARDLLLGSYAGLIAATARKSALAVGADGRNGSMDRSDAEQEGWRIAAEALDGFESGRGARLGSYLVSAIRRKTAKTAAESASQVQTGTNDNDRKVLRRFGRHSALLSQELDRQLGDADLPLLAARMEVPEYALRRMLPRVSGYDVSADVPTHEGGASVSRSMLVSDSDVLREAQESEVKRLRMEILRDAVGRVFLRSQREILSLQLEALDQDLGWGGETEWMAARLGISEPALRKRLRRATAALKDAVAQSLRRRGMRIGDLLED